MTGDLIIENEQPPLEVMDDFQALNRAVKVERVTISDGPNAGWTMSIEHRSDEEKFEDIRSLVETSVSNTNDIRSSFDRPSKEHWLIQLRY